jgi:hypothetical protein
MSTTPLLFPGTVVATDALAVSTGAPSNSTVMTEASVVRLATTTAVFFRISDGATVATNQYPILPADGVIFLSLGIGQRVSVLGITAAGNATVNLVKPTTF